MPRKQTSPAPAARLFSGALAPREIFLSRLRRSAKYAIALIAITLAIGTVGYHVLEDSSWLDAFHQASLLLSGEGPVIAIKSSAGKLFDAVYALFCGVILLAAVALLFTPVFHRLMHRFHIEDAGDR